MPPSDPAAPDVPGTAEAPAVAVGDPAPAGRRQPVILVAVVAIGLVAGAGLFLSGYSMGRQSAVEPGTPVSDEEAFRPFWDTYHTITERYAGGPVDREAIVNGAISGMIGALGDPYSSYLSSDAYRQSLQGISGQFEGIGAQLASEGPDGTQGCATLGPVCRLVILAPITGSPAERAGLLPGDQVLAADGEPLDGLTVDSASSRIRGPRGSVVVLTVRRGSKVPFPLPITRDVIQQPEVESKVLADGAVGYVKLSGFSDASATGVADAIRAHVAAGRTRLVFDLRGDPGGYVTAARAVASQFIGAGPIFTEQFADGTQLVTDALAGGAATDPDIQVVCLIDGGSASASEIVAGALQDTHRATLVGQRSFGKGTIQQWQELTGEGGAFRLTIAKWLTPAQRWIHGTGLTPDVTVDLPATVPPGTDPTLDRAVDVLQGGG